MSQGPLGANWGDGFATDAEAVAILQQSGLTAGDPNPFFQKLMVCWLQLLPIMRQHVAALCMLLTDADCRTQRSLAS